VSQYTIINADYPDERIVCDWDAGEALDTSDKATNKAVTASQKYFLMKLFNISDKDDPDSESHEVPAQAKVASRPNTATPQASASNPVSDKQASMIAKLLQEKFTSKQDAQEWLVSAIGSTSPTNSAEASTVIDGLMKLRNNAPKLTNKPVGDLVLKDIGEFTGGDMPYGWPDDLSELQP
jgi:hypothetical protein